MDPHGPYRTLGPGSAGMTAMSVLCAAEASWEVVVANDAAHAKVPRVALEVGCIWLVG